MIYYVSMREHSHTIDRHLDIWGKDISKIIKPISYEALKRKNSLPAGVWIFTDIDRLSTQDRAELNATFIALRDSQECKIFNDPASAKLRYELLRLANITGLQTSNVYLASEHCNNINYPVFIRDKNSHEGPEEKLIHDNETLKTEITNLILRKSLSKDDVLITEFVDYKTNNLYQKYSCMILEGKIFPRHILSDTHWMVKAPKVYNDELLVQESVFINTNPHEEWVRKTAELAGIQWGRIDYGVYKDQFVLFEINTNPGITHQGVKAYPARDKFVEQFFTQLNNEILNLHTSQPESRLKVKTNQRFLNIKHDLKTVIKPTARKWLSTIGMYAKTAQFIKNINKNIFR